MTTEERLRIATETRDVYLKQHSKYMEDPILFDRFLKMVSDPAYFQLKPEDFRGKRILDAGCGNTAYFEVAMHRLGVEKITCLDLGNEWIAPLSAALTTFGVPESATEFVSGSTDKLPFPDESFDMVFSNGVLIHLVDMPQITHAFKELARVTKKGGSLYVILGVPGGMLETELVPAVRRYYRSNPEFKTFIDTLSPQTFVQIADVIAKGMQAHTGEKPAWSEEHIKRMFDLDLCAFFQNVVQVPTRIILECDEAWAKKTFRENGFGDPMRCRRYVKRKNIRKLLAPLHYDDSSTFSRILYGPGNLEFIARKAS